MKRLTQFLISEVEPSDTNIGWIKPSNNGLYDIMMNIGGTWTKDNNSEKVDKLDLSSIKNIIDSTANPFNPDNLTTGIYIVTKQDALGAVSIYIVARDFQLRLHNNTLQSRYYTLGSFTGWVDYVHGAE